MDGRLDEPDLLTKYLFINDATLQARLINDHDQAFKTGY